MDNKQLTSVLAEKTGLNPAAAATVLSALTDIIAENCAQMNSVAIPGFGTFSSLKKDEYIVQDSDGDRTLMPPSVSVRFNPSVVLRKKL